MIIPDEQIKESRERWIEINNRTEGEIKILRDKIHLLVIQNSKAYQEVCNCSKEWKKTHSCDCELCEIICNH